MYYVSIFEDSNIYEYLWSTKVMARNIKEKLRTIEPQNVLLFGTKASSSSTGGIS